MQIILAVVGTIIALLSFYFLLQEPEIHVSSVHEVPEKHTSTMIEMEVEPSGIEQQSTKVHAGVNARGEKPPVVEKSVVPRDPFEKDIVYDRNHKLRIALVDKSTPEISHGIKYNANIQVDGKRFTLQVPATLLNNALVVRIASLDKGTVTELPLPFGAELSNQKDSPTMSVNTEDPENYEVIYPDQDKPSPFP